MHQAACVGCLIFRLNMQESSLLSFIKMNQIFLDCSYISGLYYFLKDFR